MQKEHQKIMSSPNFVDRKVYNENVLGYLKRHTIMKLDTLIYSFKITGTHLIFSSKTSSKYLLLDRNNLTVPYFIVFLSINYTTSLGIDSFLHNFPDIIRFQ